MTIVLADVRLLAGVTNAREKPRNQPKKFAEIMGLDDRSYAREGFRSDGGGWGSGGVDGGSVAEWPVWKKIIAVNVVVFLLQIFITRPATINDFAWQIDEIRQSLPADQVLDEAEVLEYAEAQLAYAPPISVVQEWFELDSAKVLRGQVWRVITAGFCHDRLGIWHLLFNMLFLFWFGSRLENRYGAREFCCFYFCSLLVSSAAYLAIDLYTGRMGAAIGASGAVWGVVALYAMLYPYERIYVYFLFPVQIRFLALVYFAFDLHPVLLALSGQQLGTGIAHAAHIGGALFGFAYWYFRWRLVPLLAWLPGTRRKSSIRWANSRPASAKSRSASQRETIYPFPTADKVRNVDSSNEARMDQLLDKISREGKDSLSQEELEFLVDTSRRLRGN